jgi:hypothetical protein
VAEIVKSDEYGKTRNVIQKYFRYNWTNFKATKEPLR